MKSTENLSLNVQLDADLLDLQQYGYSLVPGNCDDAVDFSRLANSSLTPVPGWRHQLEGEEEAKEAEFDVGVAATPPGSKWAAPATDLRLGLAGPSVRSIAKGMPVLVHVYDVSQGPAIQHINQVFAHRSFPVKFGGVFHVGVEVNGLEWCYGFSARKTDPGISCITAKVSCAES